MGLARVALAGGTGELGAERLTQSGQVMGTCDYMAPEQAYDTHRADHRSDVYSLGCTLHRLLTGNPPYSRETLMQVLLAHREARIPSLRDARPDVPERVDEVFRKMVAKEPEDRQQSMAEVIAELEECLRLVARPATVASVPDESRSAAASDSLLQNLSFLQESVPPPLPGRRFRAASRDDAPRPAAYDQTGASIASRIKQAMAGSGPKPLALLAVAGASALLVVVVALVLNFAGRGPTADLSLPPRERRGEGKPSKALASARHSPSDQPKRKGAAPPLAIAPFDTAAARNHQKAWADYLGVPVETTNSIGMKLVLIPPGEFDMGSTQEEVDQHLKEAEKNYEQWYMEHLAAEAPRHRVRLTKPFHLGACEITVGAFRRFVDDTGYKSDAEKDGKGGYGLDEKGGWTQKPEFVWRNPSYPQTDAHPVVIVSWNDAAAFCQWLSRKESKEYRLATEAEWEYTCRAGSTTRYSFGDEEAALGDYAWWNGNSGGKAHPVGEKKPNDWGLYDMHGNVLEWCADWNDTKYYEKSPKDDPPGPTSGASRVLRGGSWNSRPGSPRSALRLGSSPDFRYDNLGFRVARTP
jgi:formylglycine-generating enzyme required for sulfatase activity